MMDDRRKVLELFEEHKNFVDEKVSEGIEKYRKGNGMIRVVDASGAPVANAKIKLDQKTHEFRFGANIFMLDELETPEKNEKYKKYFADVFNMATLPFYWANLEPRPDFLRFDKDSPKDYRRPAPDLCLEYCEEKGIEPKLHCLVYDQWSPLWLPEDAHEIKALLDKRIRSA